MKKILTKNFVLSVVILSGVCVAVLSQGLPNSPAYNGSVFENVWDSVNSNPYQKLPHRKISFWSTLKWFKNQAQAAALRTLNDQTDFRQERFVKLAHPNGICLKGVWEITEKNPYGGYFKKDSLAMFIARASVAMSETRHLNSLGVETKRAFGLAGKLFPIQTENDSRNVQTANFFVVDDLGGTKAEHFTDVKLTNEPLSSKTSQVALHFPYAISLLLNFGSADKVTSGYNNPGVRQLFEISELSESHPASVLTPQWMQISAEDGQTVNENDFRDELNLENYASGKLVFNIAVTSTAGSDGRATDFNQIGRIVFDESVASVSCDQRLHFHHPKWRTDLKYQ